MTNSGTQLQSIGTVSSISGTVRAQAPGQPPRILTEGGIIYANDRIMTGPEGSLAIEFSDGATRLDLGRMSDMVLTEDVFQDGFPASPEEAIADIEQIQEAILTGEFDPTVDTEAPAAGPDPVASAGGGTTIVRFDLEGQEVTPESGAPTEATPFGFVEPGAEPLPSDEAPAPIIAAAPADGGGDIDFSPSAGSYSGIVEERGLEEGTDGPDASLTAVNGTFGDLGIDFGGDGAGFITFNPVGGTPVTVVLDGSVATETQIVGTYGTLTVYGNSTWQYQITDNTIDHDEINQTGADDTVPDNFIFTVYDSDGDSASGTLNITIYDDGPVVLDDTISRVVEEEAIQTTGMGEILPITTSELYGVETSTVQEWTLVHNGGQLSIDMFSEYGPGDFTNSETDNLPYTDIDGDGIQEPVDLTILLYDSSGTLIWWYSDDEPTDGNSSVNTADPFLSLDLPAGSYSLYVGSYDLTSLEALNGVNVNEFSNDWGPAGPYQLFVTGDTTIIPPIGGTVTPVLSHGNPDNNDLDPEDATQPDSAVVTGTLLDTIVDIGADDDFTSSPYIAFQLLDNTEDLPDLLSQGVPIYYVINGDTLEAWAGYPPTDDYTPGDGDGEIPIQRMQQIENGGEEGDRLVFTFELEENGDYTFTLLDQLDHIRPEPGTSDENSDLQQVYGDSDIAEPVLGIDVSTLIRATDADGDYVEFEPGTVFFTIEDDTPIFTGLSIQRVVEEEALDNPQSTGNQEDLDPVEDSHYTGSTTQNDQYWVSGTLATLISIGSDEWPDEWGPFSFDVESIMAEGAEGGLTSKGEAIEYRIGTGENGHPALIAYVPTEEQENGRALLSEISDDSDSVEGRTVFTLELSVTGEYTFTLVDQLDHDDDAANGENTLDIDFAPFINVTDYDGDSINLGDYNQNNEEPSQEPNEDVQPAFVSAPQSLFTITVVDDIPAEAVDVNPVTATVHEDALSMWYHQSNHEDPVDASEGSSTTMHNDNDTASGNSSGWLTTLVDDGADEDVTYGILDVTKGLPDLYSKGKLVEYKVTQGESEDTLEATAHGNTIFTLTVRHDGYWEFDLDDQLDHVAGDDKNTALRTTLDGSESVDYVDFSSIILVQDFDLDTIPISADMFTMTITDDVPVLTCNRVTGFVEEDGMSYADEPGDGPYDADNSEGNDNWWEGPNDDEDWSARGENLHTLVRDGADENITFKIADLETVVKPYMEAQGLTSQGRALEYEVHGNSVRGFTTMSGETLTVFTLHIGAQNGTWYFDLDDQLDHNYGWGENIGLQSNQQISSVTNIDFSGIVLAVDADGDEVPLRDGQFTMIVQDDVPIVSDPTGFSIIYNEEFAGYDNIIGTYELDENGDPTNPQIVMTSSDGYSDHSGNELTFSSSHSDNVKLFIIADGANKVGDLSDKTLTFGEDSNGNPILIIDGVTSDYAADFHKGIYFMDKNLNVDGEDHFRIYNDGTVGPVVDSLSDPALGTNDIGIEDLAGTNVYGENSDHDYDDTVLDLVPGFGVRESALEDGGSLPSESARTVSGNFLNDGNISVGADEPATIAIYFNEEWHTITLDGAGGYITVGGNVEGDELDYAGQLTIDSEGNWTYELVDNTHNHTDTDLTDGDSDRELADGTVTDHFDIWVRDFDHDWARMNLNVNIYDDGPSIDISDVEPLETGYVQEDALGNETNNPLNNETVDDDANNPGILDEPAKTSMETDSTVFDLGSIVNNASASVDFGADGEGAVSYSITGLDDPVLSDYTSDGQYIWYVKSGNTTIEARTCDSDSIYTSGGDVVFTLTLDGNAQTATFDLKDQIDHLEKIEQDADNDSLNISDLGKYIQYTITDGDGDSASVTFDGKLTVNVENDVPEALSVNTVPENLNLVLILDTSGSMRSGQIQWTNPDDTTSWISRAAALQLAIEGALGTMEASDADNIRIHVVTYNDDAPEGLTFDLKSGGNVNQSATSIATAIAAMDTGTFTNYEAGLASALDWTDGNQATVPLSMTGVQNQVIFISDGDPNTWNTQSGTHTDTSDSGMDYALEEATSTTENHVPNTGTNEFGELSAWADSVNAVGILINDPDSYARLNALDTTANGAENIYDANGLITILPQLITTTESIITLDIEEDDMGNDGDNALGDDPDNALGYNEIGDNSYNADETSGGNLADLFNSGADEKLTFSMLNSTSNLPTLYSNGLPVIYAIAGNTLTATAQSGEVIFTFTIEKDGSYHFDLDGKLDHVDDGTDSENYELVSGDDGDDSVNGIDLSSIILATDADNDSAPAATGAFVVQVQDDIPVAMDDTGSMFGYSSYEGTGDEVPSAYFDVLANDTSGADNDLTLVTDPSAISVNGGGTATVEDGQILFTPGENFSGESVVTYTVVDNDGDQTTGTLTITERYLKVGTNADDSGNSETDYAVGEGSGTITGGDAGDILVGDFGGTTTTVTGGDVNLLFILDVSGSMGGSQIVTLRASVTNILNKISNGDILADADNVRINLVTFSSDASQKGTFDIKGSGDGTVGDLSDAISVVNGLGTGGVTNYEAGMQTGLAWTALSESSGGPLEGSDVANQVMFLTDGDPNEWNGSPSYSYFYTTEAMKQIFGTSQYDSTNEVQALQGWGDLRAVGLLINEGTSSDGRLDLIDEHGDAINVNHASQLESSIIQAITETEEHLASVGNDTIDGGDGDDLIFGDALYTDDVFADLNLGVDASTYSLDAGAGWAVFEALENDTSLDWSREDTINYIQEHSEYLAQESVMGDETRSGGDDLLFGGEGDDIIFGQESSSLEMSDSEMETLLGDPSSVSGSADILDGGAGNDYLDGGSGTDILLGDEDNDILIGGKDQDILSGDEGDDILVGESVSHDGSGHTTVINDGENDYLQGGAGTDRAVPDDTGTNSTDGEVDSEINVSTEDLDTLIPPPDVDV